MPNPDAGLGDNVPHMRQTRIEILKDGVSLETGMQLGALWWNGHSIVVRIEGREYSMGAASGDGCNCLIDTFRQCMHLICNVSLIRGLLERQHAGTNTHILPGDYLQLDCHWRILTLTSVGWFAST